MGYHTPTALEALMLVLQQLAVKAEMQVISQPTRYFCEPSELYRNVSLKHPLLGGIMSYECSLWLDILSAL